MIKELDPSGLVKKLRAKLLMQALRLHDSLSDILGRAGVCWDHNELLIQVFDSPIVNSKSLLLRLTC